MLGRFRVESDDIGAGLGEIRHDAVDRPDHQMNIDRHFHMRPDRLADQRADGQVRHVMIVHHVKMDPVGARLHHRAHFLPQPREVSGQDAGSNSVSGGHRNLWQLRLF
jgi:hypothetical protein